MTGLPDGWERVRFEEMVARDAPIIYGILQPGPEYPAGVKYVRPSEIQDGVIDLKSVRSTSPKIAAQYERSKLAAGDIILSIVGTIGKVALVPNALDGANITQSSCRLRPDRNLTDEGFLQHFLKAPQAVEQYDRKRMGTAVPRLNLADVRQFEIPLPPLPEQRRIVRKLDTLSARSATARSHLTGIENLVEWYKLAFYLEVFAAPQQQVELGTIAKVGTGATPKKGVAKYYANGTVPWVTSGAVNAKTVTKPSSFITKTAIQETNCKVFPTGSLLMAMYGEGKTRGQVARLEIAAATNQALAVIHDLDETRIDTEYLFRFLDSIYLEIREQAEGGVQPNLSLGKVKTFKVPLPTLDEQREIVRRIETAFAKIDRLAAEAAKALRLLSRLDQRILAKAFAGNLVPQDPNDEPADRLLERIRQERANGTPTKRKRRQADG